MCGARNDESAKWRRDSAAQTDSADEVFAAQDSALRGNAHAHVYCISSAWKTSGPHFEDIEAGDTATRYVARVGEAWLDAARAGFECRAAVSNATDASELRAYAAALTADSPNVPTWINAGEAYDPRFDPTMLEARNVTIFLREYGSRSSGAGKEGDYFDPLLLDAAERAELPRGVDTYHCAIDTGATRNPATIAIVGRRVCDDDRIRYWIAYLRSWKGSPGAPLDLRLVVLPAMAVEAKRYGCESWWSDGWAGAEVRIVGAERGLATTFVATGDAHTQVYDPARQGLARGHVVLAGHPLAGEAVAQLRQVSSEAGERGHTRILVPEDSAGDHGDLGVVLVRALAAAGCGQIEEAEAWIDGPASRYADTR